MTTVINIKKKTKPATGYIYIGRGSIYGNPFTHLELAESKAVVQVPDRDAAIKAYEDWLAGTAWTDIEQARRTMILESLKYLRGKTLGCYCKPLPCHGDTLIKLLEKDDE